MKINVLAWHYKSFKKQNRTKSIGSIRAINNNIAKPMFPRCNFSVFLRPHFFLWLNKERRRKPGSAFWDV